MCAYAGARNAHLQTHHQTHHLTHDTTAGDTPPAFFNTVVGVLDMRLRNVALGSGTALGAAALFNQAVAGDGGTLGNPIGGEEGTWRWRGHRIAWTRHGQGPAVLLVHAIHAAAWNYEWRHAVGPLAESRTVWTLDLLGFGRSDRPDVHYTSALYVALIDEFAREVIGEPCALIGSSLSGAYVAAVAATSAERYPAVTVVCPTGLTHLVSPPGPVNDASRTLVASPLVGTALFNALVTRASLRFFLQQTYADSRCVTPALLDAYHATSHQPGARYAPAAFVGMALNLDVRAAVPRLTQPLLITWGDRAKEVPKRELDAWRAAQPDAEVMMFAPSGSLPHDEQAPHWCAVVHAFLQRALGERTAEPLAASA